MRNKRRLLIRSLCLVLAMILLPISAFVTGASAVEFDEVASVNGVTALQPPVISGAADGSSSVTVAAEASEEDEDAVIEYRMSKDNLVWNEWKTDGKFIGLKPETTYYFQARYVSSDLALFTNSEPSETITVKTLEYVEPVLPKLTQPVLSDAEYMVKHNTVILNAVKASSEDPDAVALYRMSADGETWGDWQSNTRFDGLSPETKYYFQAMYYATERGLWADSEPGNVVSYTTKQGALTVSVRVIGVTEPTASINFFLPKVDYKGAVHQNWIQTTVYEEVPAGTNVVPFLQEKLKENGFEVQVSATNVSIMATELFGGHTLTNKNNDTTAWYYDIQGKNGAIRYGAQLFTTGTTGLRDGDTVVLYYVFNATQEAKKSSSAYYRYFMNTPDAAVSDYEKAYAAETLIKRIGTVTAGSGKTIKAAREAYDALDELQRGLVRNYGVLTEAEEKYAGMEKAVKLDPPAAPQCLGISANSIALAESEESSIDSKATVQYRISIDGEHWGEWQESYAFTKLRSETTYYFQTRYWPSDLTKYEESEPSEIAEFKTSVPPVYTASNRQEWVELVTGAPTDGREIVIEIVDDIEVGIAGIYTTSTPGGSNITMVGKGGKLLSPGGGQLNNGICVGNGATLTLRDLEYSSIGPWGEANGIDQQTGNANFGSMIYLGGSNCTVNLENVTMYGDCTQKGVLIGNGTSDVDYSNNVVNIYSGTLDQIGGGSVNDISSYNRCMLISANGCIVNLRPQNDIILEGVIRCDSLRIIPEETVKEVSSSNSNFSDRADLKFDLERINAANDQEPYKVNITNCGGVRVIVSDSGTAFPEKLIAPKVTADMFVVEKAKVSVPSDLVSKQQDNAILQYRVYEGRDGNYNLLPYQKWMSRPLTFDIELKEDTEYRFELRYNAIGGNYANSDNTVMYIRTGYTTRTLEAPNLITVDSKTMDSITLRAPAASEQDANAAVQYRISADGENWEAWQDAVLFDGLEAGKIYYFQSRFEPDSYLWTISEPSSTLQVMTKTPTLAAPTLNADGATVTASSVTLAAPSKSAEDSAAAIEYRMAKDIISLENAKWQASAHFDALQPCTTYYFQARYVSSSSAWLNSEGGETVVIATGVSAQKPTFAVSNISGLAGETVKVNIYIDGNPGIQAAELTVKYDASKVTMLDEAVCGTIMTGFVPGREAVAGQRSFIFYTPDYRNTVKNGIMLTLSFRIDENCAEGTVPVTVEYAAGDVYDENETNVAFSVNSGSITVVGSGTSGSLLGDIDGDGVVGQKDVTVLIKYLADVDVSIDAEAADLNADDMVDLLDLIILRRHLVGWAGYGILPC